MKTLFISDTHGYHDHLLVEDNTEMIIHSGDASNFRSPAFNFNEMVNFISWYKKQKAKYKVFVGGNHDTSLEARLVTKQMFLEAGIIYLEHEFIEIEGLKLFGSPYNPEFHNWAFNVARSRLNEYWENIPLDTDILITHTPPKGILDLANKENDEIEYCGCSALYKKVIKINPKFHVFGHIHNNYDNVNAGYRTINKCDTIFINATCLKDGAFNRGLHSQGIYFNVVKGQQSAGDK